MFLTHSFLLFFFLSSASPPLGFPLPTSLPLLSSSFDQGKTQETEAFDQAKKTNTPQAWEEFLRRFPSSSRRKRVKEFLDQALLLLARKSDSDPKALASLYKRCRTVKGADALFALWDESSWKSALKGGTEQSLHEYLLRFPGGKFATKARRGIDDVLWKNAETKGSVEAFREYLIRVPAGIHRTHALARIRDLGFAELKRNPTIPKVQAFLKANYKHKEAQRLLYQLLYDRALQTRKTSDWIRFFDQANGRSYRYSRYKKKRDKALLQMLANAQIEIERGLFEEILDTPTLVLCKEYKKRFPKGLHSPQVDLRLEEALFQTALKRAKPDDFVAYLARYPRGFHNKEVRKNFGTYLKKEVGDPKWLTFFHRYLRFFSKSERKRILPALEPSMRAWAKKRKSELDYKLYIQQFGKNPNAGEIIDLLEPILFKKARKADWFTEYQSYLKLIPKGKRAEEIAGRLSFLRTHKAQVKLVSVKEVKSSGTRWSWTTRFKEVGGKVGFKLSGYGFIVDKMGKRWGTRSGYRGVRISRGTVRSGSGGTASDSYWCRGATFRGGKAVFTWTGTDAGGHRIAIVETVYLK